ncbi:MAG: hypothetical protein ACI8UO_006026 [Verrucomicrobiales bacterium]|jgi:hypothetical protein
MRWPKISFLTLLAALAAAALAKGFEASVEYTRAPGPRTERMIDGLRIEYPEDEADLVDLLKRDLSYERQIRRDIVKAESKSMNFELDNSESDELIRGFRTKILKFLQLEELSGFEERFAETAKEMDSLSNIWRHWAGDFTHIRIHNNREFPKFLIRDQAYVFDHMAFIKDGGWGFRPPFAKGGIGLDAFDLRMENLEPVVLDMPLFYRPGKTPREILVPARAFLQQARDSMTETAKEVISLSGDWLFETLLAGEVDQLFADEAKVLGAGVARFLLVVSVASSISEADYIALAPKLYQFSVQLDETPQQLLEQMSSLDVRADLSQADPLLRRRAEHLIALVLANLTKNSPGLFQNFKTAGVEMPEGGFTWESFEKAIDLGFNGEDLFEKQLKIDLAALVKPFESIGAKTFAPGSHPLQVARLSRTFGETTFTFPPEISDAIDRVGPEIADTIAEGIKNIEANLADQERIELRYDESDEAALRAYGIQPDSGIAHTFRIEGNMLVNPRILIDKFFNGGRINIWPQDHISEILKANGAVTGFLLSTDGEDVSFSFGLNFKPDEGDHSAETSIESLPGMELPLILGEFDPDSRDVDGQAEQVLESAEWFLKAYRTSEPEKVASQLGGFRMMSETRATFVMIHETVEVALVDQVIASDERRWFCDGMANWVAIQDLDRRFGEGAGMKAFEAAYDQEALLLLADQVDLPAWPAGEANVEEPVENFDAAHYYFATLALIEALEGRDADFVSEWLAETQKTSWNRTNIGTIAAAYQKLTGDDLLAIVAGVTKMKGGE